MKFRRIMSVLLAVVIVVSCAVVAGTVAATGADTAIAASGSAYEDMLEKTSAANGYGLMDTVNDSTILQAWTWSFQNIEANLETIAEQGFTTIQVSPPNEIKTGTSGAYFLQSDNKNGWWMYYQPAGFQINESTDNALGTKADFVSMCEKAHELGLKIIVDAVINHMGTKDGDDNNTSTDPMSHVTPKAATFEPEIYNNKLFHSPWKQMQYIESNDTQYNSTYDLTRNCTSGLPDLKTEDSRVQSAIYDYLEELIEAGADGFRFDAAKHIETPDDISSLASDFWTNTLVKVQKAHSDQEIYAYGEILNTCGINRPYSMYFKLMQVTDNAAHRDSIMPAVKNGSGTAFPYYNDTGNSAFTKANTVLWEESHDTYIDGTTTSLTVTQRNKIWACVAGRSDITGVYLARPDDGTSTSALYSIKIGEAKKTSWSNDVTKAVNQFHNYFAGQGEYCTVSGNKAYIERGTQGAVIVTLGSTNGGSVSLTSHTLANGNYIDAISGNTFTVNNKKITGKVGSTGVACIYYDSEYVNPNPDPDPDPDSYTIIFSNNKGLNTPVYIYYWADGEDGPVEWPGVEMDYYDTNDYGENRYSATVSTDYDYYIINDGSTQSIDISLSGSTGVYFTDQDSEGHYQVDFYAIDNDDPDPDPDGYTIIFSNNKGLNTPVYIYYWADGEDGPVEWPGVEMSYYDTNDYGENRYKATVSADYDYYIINDGSTQSVDITLSGSTGVYFTDQDSEGHYQVDFYAIDNDDPDPDPNPDPVGSRTIIFSNNKGFSTVNIYYWATGSEGPVDWPGVAMDYYDTNEFGENRYRFDMPEGYDNYIITDGSSQTVDIPFDGAVGVYMLDEQDDEGHYKVDFYEIDYVDPTDPPTPTQAPTQKPTDPPFTYLLGDADLDGTVDAVDANLIVRYAIGLSDLSEKQLLAANVDGDSAGVTVLDATWIQRYAIKLAVKYPVGETQSAYL